MTRKPTAVVRRPSPDLGWAELTFLDRTPIDVDQAMAQHRSYVDLLAELGHPIMCLPELPHQPDGTFVEDTVVVVDGLAVLTRPGAPSRRPEVPSTRAAMTHLGCAITQVEPPATLDGGDVLQVGDTVLVGLSSRTNADGVDQLRRLLEPRRRDVRAVGVTGCLHLKTGATALPDGHTLLVAPGTIDVEACERAGLSALPVVERGGANVLLSGSTVVMSAAAPRTAELVRKRGFTVRTLDLSELERAEAGPTCLSVLVGR